MCLDTHMHLLNITKHISSPLNILNMYLNFTIDFIRVHEFIKHLNIIDYIDGGPTIYLCGTLCTLGMGLG